MKAYISIDMRESVALSGKSRRTRRREAMRTSRVDTR